jgi:hypothetical protein
MVLRLDLAALWFPLTEIPPALVGLILVVGSLQLRIFTHGLGVLPVKHFRKSLAHTQHIRVLAFNEVVPWREILESCHREAFRAGEGDEGEAVLRGRLESFPAREVDDNALLQCEALCLVHGERIARDNRELLACLSCAFFRAHLGQYGYPLRIVFRLFHCAALLHSFRARAGLSAITSTSGGTSGHLSLR